MRKFFLILYILILSSFPFQGEAQEPGSIQIYFFHSKECQSCGPILQNYLPGLKTMYPSLDVKLFDVGEASNYETLLSLERKLGQAGKELPVLLIGDQLLSGEQEIMGKLEMIIQEYQIAGAPLLPALSTVPSITPSSQKTISVEMAYFYQKGCPKCERANVLLKYLSQKYPHLRIKEIDLNTPDGKRLNETFSSRVHLPPEKRLIAPSIFIGSDVLLPEDLTEPNLEALIRKYETSEAPSTLEVQKAEITKAEESMVERFKSLGLVTILSAGLIDGLNPCAFATLIFFISYLTMIGRKRGEILWVGLGFSMAVFATYLLIGFGILSFVQHLSFLPLFSKIVYLLTIAFALFLGTLSLYDYVQLKRGRPSEMKLQLPDFLKKRIHHTIRARREDLGADQENRFSRYFFAAVAAGFIISLLEFTCTGQVYLPTILFVTNIPSLRTSAFSYLILYNVMFIVPLLVIFGIVYWGVTSEQLGFFLKKRASAIKLVTSLLFFALAGILILSVI